MALPPRWVIDVYKRQEQAAAEVCGVHNVDDHIGIFVLYVGAGDTLLTGEGRHGIGAGQVHSDLSLIHI